MSSPEWGPRHGGPPVPKPEPAPPLRIRDAVLAVWRMLRYNPFSHRGYDPVAAHTVFRRARPRRSLGLIVAHIVTLACLVAFVVGLVMDWAAVKSGENPPGAQTSDMLVGMAFFVGLLAVPTALIREFRHRRVVRAYRRQQEEARRRREAAERWRQSRPEAVIARSPDPLDAVRAVTAKANGGVFLGIAPDDREWRAAEREQSVLVLGPPRSGKTETLPPSSPTGANPLTTNGRAHHRAAVSSPRVYPRQVS